MPLSIVPSWFSLVLAAVLSGCALSPSSQALVDAGRRLLPGGSEPAAQPRLDSRFAYLRFQREGRVVYLARGYVDPHPLGSVEVWYSSGGEVLRFLDGRLFGSQGGTTDWLSVSYEGLPAWTTIDRRIVYQRTRDAHPGYRYGLREQVYVQPIARPASSHLTGLRADALAWFEEGVVGRSELPPSRYAVRFTPAGARVMYAEQCLAGDLCFSWQRWTAAGAEGG